MSRYGTPASELGRLAIGGSSSSSSSDMPVTTRAMRRGQASGGSVSQQSSRTVAGPSRTSGRSSGRRRRAQGGRQMAGNGRSDDSDDDDGGSSDGSDEDDAAARRLRREIMMAAFETAAALDQQLLSPRELMAADPRDTPQRRLASAIATRFRDENDLNLLRGVLSRAEAFDRVRANFRRRYDHITYDLAVNVANASQGTNVVNGFQRIRNLADAIGNHIHFYDDQQALPRDHGRTLVGILFDILDYIASRDEDLYANVNIPRAQYAGGGNTGNIFREFVRQPMVIIEALQRVPAALMAERQNAFVAVFAKVRDNGPENGDQAQFRQLLVSLQQIHQRMRAE